MNEQQQLIDSLKNELHDLEENLTQKTNEIQELHKLVQTGTESKLAQEIESLKEELSISQEELSQLRCRFTMIVII